jgi:hypothetical protein
VLESARKDRELSQSQALSHDQYVKDFLANALNQDIEIRIRLATYFSNVSDTTYKLGWSKYLADLEQLRDSLRLQINADERKLLNLQQAGSADQAEITELKRNLAWRYGELGYSEPNRDVVSNPRAPASVSFQPVAALDATVLFTAQNTTGVARCLAASGIKYVARYYRPSTSRIASVTHDEIIALASNGVRVVAVQAGASASPGRFSAAYGKQTATETFSYARSVGQPGGTAIFFVVDFDPTSDLIESAVKPFFASINEVNKSESDLARRYRIGAYGSGAVIQSLRSAGLIDFGWLALATGWNGSANVLKDQTWDLRLASADGPSPCGGLSMDQTVISSRVNGADVSFTISP